MSKMSAGPSAAVAVLLYMGVAACGEEPCPPGYTKRDICYRNKDGGAQDTSKVGSDDASADADADGNAGSGDRTAVDAGDQRRPSDEPDEIKSDATTPSGDAAAADAAPPDAAPVDGATVIDAGDERDAAVGAGPVTCASNPCQNGGSCTDQPSGFHCSCTEPFMGQQCEARTCSTTYLRTPDDLMKAKSCAEIQGDLTITSAGIPSITENDLPYLTRITGHFSMSSLANNGVETPRLRRLTLIKLREIGKSLNVAQTGQGSVIEMRFPALTHVEGGVVLGNTETRILELPALRTIGTGFWLTALRQLCTLEIDAIEEISGTLMLVDVVNLPTSVLEPVRRAFSGTPTDDSRIGCCLPVDSKCVGGLSIEDRNAFCGCSPR